jgi:hypothetical protein
VQHVIDSGFQLLGGQPPNFGQLKYVAQIISDSGVTSRVEEIDRSHRTVNLLHSSCLFG